MPSPQSSSHSSTPTSPTSRLAPPSWALSLSCFSEAPGSCRGPGSSSRPKPLAPSGWSLLRSTSGRSRPRRPRASAVGGSPQKAPSSAPGSCSRLPTSHGYERGSGPRSPASRSYQQWSVTRLAISGARRWAIWPSASVHSAYMNSSSAFLLASTAISGPIAARHPFSKSLLAPWYWCSCFYCIRRRPPR